MTSLIHVAGWTLIHFVWQGALIGVAAACALRLLRGSAASTRYLVACGALATAMAAPILTARTVGLSQAPQPAPESRPAPVSPLPRIDPASARNLLTAGRQLVPERTIRFVVDRSLPFVVGTWAAGVLLLFVRLVGGWRRVRRLQRTALATSVSAWQTAGDRLASRLGLTRRISIVDSGVVETPTVVGWLRPVVLMPVAALANLTPFQVDAILAHELAHVRRHDFLVNLLQTVAETVLFYHPAVWWISGRIRAERELCCDDIVVDVCGDAAGYAAALTELEIRRISAEPQALAMAATSGSLLERVRRLLRAPTEPAPPSLSAILTAALVLLFVVAASGIDRVRTGIAAARTDARVDEHREAEQAVRNAVVDVQQRADEIRAAAEQTNRRVRPVDVRPDSKMAARLQPDTIGLSEGRAAQSPVATGDTRLAFEVASIKRNVSGEQNASVRAQPGGRLTVTNNTLFNIVRNAYGVQPFQIVRAERVPAWFDSERWDIVAKAKDNATPQQLMTMLQNLLADRFKIVLRREPRDMPVYALIVSRSDGRLGPQLKPSSLDCAALAAARAAGAPPPPAPAGNGPFCGTRTGRGTVMTSGVPLADFARNLGPMTGRFVVDRTGLAGPYDLELKWTPENAPAATDAPNSPLSDGTSLFTAIQEQLGLKLEAQRAPVDVLLIDSADRPTED